MRCQNKAKLGRLWAKKSKWIVATDGGLKDRLWTSGIVLYNLDIKEEVCTIQTAETCNSGKLDSTREELRGNLAAEIMLNQIGDEFGRGVEQDVQYVSDSRNALLKIQSTTMHPLEPKYDMFASIREIKKDNENIIRTYMWVKAHQDKDRKTIQEKLNDRTDELATISRRNAATGILGVDQKLFYESSKAALTIDGRVITKNIHGEIAQEIYKDDTKEYYKKKHEWGDQMIGKIDWEVMGASLKV